MSASTETSRPTPRMKITTTETPAPPWMGVKFTCYNCPAKWQLVAADPCEIVNGVIVTPACTCGGRNVVEIPNAANESGEQETRKGRKP